MKYTSPTLQARMFYPHAMIYLLVLTQLVSTLLMTGVIWFVQIVHYPLFGRIDRASFPIYEAEHQRRTTTVVMPLMFLELGSALGLFVYTPPAFPSWAVWAGVVLLAVIWLSTFFLQVPRHERLARNFDEDTHRELVGTNWVRTVCWSARSALAVWATVLLS